jgi:hypothetical protein
MTISEKMIVGLFSVWGVGILTAIIGVLSQNEGLEVMGVPVVVVTGIALLPLVVVELIKSL